MISEFVAELYAVTSENIIKCSVWVSSAPKRSGQRREAVLLVCN